MDDLKECFDILATVAVAGKDDLKDIVTANLALTKTVVDLTDIDACLVKKLESWRSSGGGRGGGSGGRGNRTKGKWCKNCKRKSWHEEDTYFELEKNKSARPNH